MPSVTKNSFLSLWRKPGLEGELDVSHEASLFEEFRERITGGSARANYALSRGYTRLREIPHRLQPPNPILDEGEEGENVVSDRVKWLEDKVPNEDWDKWERWVDSLDINIESPGEGDTEMPNYKITNHAEVRMSQRAVRHEDVELVLTCGDSNRPLRVAHETRRRRARD